MIETISLSKHFGAIKAVDSLSFKVEPGEVLGFLGPNGAGKSTTMKMLTCFLTPSSGTAKVCGHDVIDDPMGVKKSIGYLPETAPAYGEMSVQAFLKFIASIRGLTGQTGTKAVNSAIEKCSLESVVDQTFETLSKGYKRRVCLAQAILHDPPVLIMDEPTDGLDPNQKHEVRGLISRMSKDKVIILSTHILEEVDAACSRAVLIARGKLVADETPAELRKRAPLHGSVTLSLHGDKNAVRDALNRAPHVQKVESLEGSDGLIKFHVIPNRGKSVAAGLTELGREKKWEFNEFYVEQGRLDDVFRELTQGKAGEKPARAEAAKAEGEGEK